MALRFDRYRLDPADRRLDGPEGLVELNPKAFDVLAVLVARPGRLVTKDELLDAVWPDAHVADGVLKVSVAELRKALGDSATTPRFIATVHRRGYRFVAPVEEAAERPAARAAPAAGGLAPVSGALVAWPAGGFAAADPSAVGLVGRDREVAELEARVAGAGAGERQVVFVTGEAGAGKTALVEHFVGIVAARERVAITGSQCLEQFGAAEPYLPILEALGRLARASSGVRPLLRRYAPTWLAQLPWLVEDDDRAAFERALRGTARERMLREMAELAEAIAAETPLVVVLDDLHWSDPSSVDLLAMVAGRREPARLLVIGTYRPAEVILQRHPLRAVTQRLAASRRAGELALDDLAVEAVAEYLDRRFAGSRFPAELVRLVRKRSDGNPLFLVTLVDHLLARGAIVERDRGWHAGKDLRGELDAVPESLRRLIEQQLERLDGADRALLEAASLVGVEFSAAAAAAGAGRDPGDAELRCAALATSGPFLRATGSAVWPDRTVAGSFAFRHPLYREVLAAGVPARRRAATHLRIGTLLEQAYGASLAQLAAELAVHFEEGGDRPKAIHHRRLAAQVAADRHAFTEAEAHLAKALELVAALPASRERDREELGLQCLVGAVRMATRGFAAPEVGAAYTRALELSADAAAGPAAFPVLWGIWVFYAVGGELDRAFGLAERLRATAEASGDRLLRLEAHHALWTMHFFRGDLGAATRHLDAGEPLYEPDDRRAALVYGNDPKAAALGYRALVEWMRGAADRAVALAEAGVVHARAFEHPMSVAQAMIFAAWVRLLRREPEAARAGADAAIAYCAARELPFWMPNGLQIRGWALVELGRPDEGLGEWRRGIELWDAVRGSLGRTAYDALFAAAMARAGRYDEARAALARCRAVVDASGERYHEAEILRIDAELVLAADGGPTRASAAARRAAADLLRRSISCARQRGARSFELRAATARAAVLAGDPEADAARADLRDLVGSFGEGLDGADLRDARNLI